MKDGIEYFREERRQKHEVKKAVTENKIRLAQSEQTHNQSWEMKQLENAGWKDDVLFFAWIGFFAWSGFDPEGAGEVIKAWEQLPDWFLQVTFWIVAAVLGVKKLGDYLPNAMQALKGMAPKK